MLALAACACCGAIAMAVLLELLMLLLQNLSLLRGKWRATSNSIQVCRLDQMLLLLCDHNCFVLLHQPSGAITYAMMRRVLVFRCWC
jgi:hypothetical protein